MKTEHLLTLTERAAPEWAIDGDTAETEMSEEAKRLLREVRQARMFSAPTKGEEVWGEMIDQKISEARSK